MRYYFHLMSDTECLRDLRGVEADSLDQAFLGALMTLQELRDADDANWSGWTLTAADDAGCVLFAIPLDQADFLH
jgi:uncharacterized protein DUF6894